MNITSYNKINLEELNISNNNILYNNEKFCIQTPIIESGEIKTFNDEKYIELHFLNINPHNLFLQNLKNLEKTLMDKIDSYDSLILKDTHNKISIKINIDLFNSKFYNKNKTCILPSEIYQKTKCICIIFLKNNQWNLYQYMRLN
jgi:hypothetical protein